MEYQLDTMNEESLNIVLKIHKGKMKSMTNMYTTDNIQIDGTEKEKLTNHEYLEQTTAMETEQSKEFP